MNDIVTKFRKVAVLEGWSFVVLLFIAMPLKYIADYPVVVKYTGWVHGVLFILYVGLLILAANTEKWNTRKWVIGFLAAWIPFGTFWLDRKIQKEPKNWA